MMWREEPSPRRTTSPFLGHSCGLSDDHLYEVDNQTVSVNPVSREAQGPTYITSGEISTYFFKNRRRINYVWAVNRDYTILPISDR